MGSPCCMSIIGNGDVGLLHLRIPHVTLHVDFKNVPCPMSLHVSPGKGFVAEFRDLYPLGKAVNYISL